MPRTVWTPEIRAQAVLGAKLNWRRLEFEAMKRDTPCKDCRGYFAQYQMQFDHLPEHEKKFEVSGPNSGSVRKISDEAWYAEMGKCDLVCTHCHQTREYFRSNYKSH